MHCTCLSLSRLYTVGIKGFWSFITYTHTSRTCISGSYSFCLYRQLILCLFIDIMGDKPLKFCGSCFLHCIDVYFWYFWRFIYFFFPAHWNVPSKMYVSGLFSKTVKRETCIWRQSDMKFSTMILSEKRLILGMFSER